MPDVAANSDRFKNIFLILLTAGISLVFLAMIRRFLIALLLAGIFAALTQPMFRWIKQRVGGRESLASGLTVVIVLVIIVGPATGLVTIVVSQAVSVTQTVGPWVQRQLSQPDNVTALLERLPYSERLLPYREPIIAKAGELAGTIGQFLVSKVAAASGMTVQFLLNLFVMLYAMFFFLTGGRAIVEKIMHYMPLESADEHRMIDRFVSVSRATLRGTLVIGLLQGMLAGAAFWVAGIGSSVFWGTVMGVLSIIPGIGGALVWIPAVVYLVISGHVAASVLLGLWCGLVVGTVDNILRPILVGKDAKLPDLLILVSTLGGIVLFGALGFIIGPIVAALFVTVWELYGTAFADMLPPVAPVAPERSEG